MQQSQTVPKHRGEETLERVRARGPPPPPTHTHTHSVKAINYPNRIKQPLPSLTQARLLFY